MRSGLEREEKKACTEQQTAGVADKRKANRQGYKAAEGLCRESLELRTCADITLLEGFPCLKFGYHILKYSMVAQAFVRNPETGPRMCCVS